MNLFNSKIMILNEADRADKYDYNENDDQKNNNDEKQNESDTKETEQEEQDVESQNNEEVEYPSNNYKTEDAYTEEELPNRMNIPQLDILDGMSEIEHSLNNLKVLEHFNELYIKVKDTLTGTTISNISTKNAKQRQVVNIVRDNLSSMLSDIHTYIHLRFGDIYEENMIAYITYLKRFKINMKLLKTIVDENTTDENK